MRTGSRLLARAFFVFAGLALSSPALAFMIELEVTNGGVSFEYEVAEEPQWRLSSGGDSYRGTSLDFARFEEEFSVSFSDSDEITLNGNPVDAKLTGKVDSECSKARIKLRDKTNDRTIVVEFPNDGGNVGLSCTGL